MAITTNTVERAFALAREGHCRSIDDIKRILKAERFDMVDGHLSGGLIKRQLQEALATAPKPVA